MICFPKSERLDEFLRSLDRFDQRLCAAGVLRPAQWSLIVSGKRKKLYAGTLSRLKPQFRTHIGITPFESTTRNICSDVRDKMPIPDCSVEVYQSEDVFEHIPYDDVPAVFNEVFRVLKPGGLFRLSLPDYRTDIFANRTLRDSSGMFIFDPGGGGRFVDGKVIDGGHLWFPIYENVFELFSHTKFGCCASVDFLHYTDKRGRFVLKDIDYSRGHIQRTPDNDERGVSPRRPISIVVDAIKI